jgi:hypothetical protein
MFPLSENLTVSFLHYTAMIENVNVLIIMNLRNAVRDDDRRFILVPLSNFLHDFVPAHLIQSTSSFVED